MSKGFRVFTERRIFTGRRAFTRCLIFTGCSTVTVFTGIGLLISTKLIYIYILGEEIIHDVGYFARYEIYTLEGISYLQAGYLTKCRISTRFRNINRLHMD